jgi:AmmeMemoRadiSam system protein B
MNYIKILKHYLSLVLISVIGEKILDLYHDKKFKNIWESIQDLDKQALDIIAELNTEKLDEYFKITRNTICGRNPISIAVSIAEKYKKNYKNKKVSFETVGYAQSNQVKSTYETSVSYAAVINFIE